MDSLSWPEKKIPTVLGLGGLLVLLVGLTLASNGISQTKKLFSFAQQSTPLSSNTNPSPTPAPSSSPSAHFKAPTTAPFSEAGGQLQVNITNGQTVSNSLPTFSGKAGARQKVKITIHSDASYTGTVIADPSGSWSWTPPAGLSEGTHTVAITIVNPDGTTQTVTRTFTVSATQPILPVTSGTPSGELTPTLTPSPSAKEAPPITGTEEKSRLILTFGLGILTLSAGLFLIAQRII